MTIILRTYGFAVSCHCFLICSKRGSLLVFALRELDKTMDLEISAQVSLCVWMVVDIMGIP